MKTKYKIFIAKLLFIFFSFLIKTKFICKRNNINYNLNLEEVIDLYIFIFGKFESEIVDTALKLNLSKKKIIIDIGANIGAQTLQFANQFKYSIVYSIEPTNYAYKKLINNLELNPFLYKRIKPFQLYINDIDCKPKKVHSSWSLTSNKKKHKEHKGIEKSISNSKNVSLDKFILKNNINNVDFIKLDVDGSELKVLQSGKDFLFKKKPIIFMELAPYLYPEFGYSILDLINFIKKMNYDFYEMHPIKKIDGVNSYINSIKPGSSKNIILM
jgi:FkbM family methyltransferase